MKNLSYSAGAVSKGFWFQGFKKYIGLLQEGKAEAEIRELQGKENIFLAPSTAYGIKMIGEVSKRAKALPKEIVNMFFNLNISDQKIVNLLGIMMTDRLFFEFLYEVYREDLILGTENFEESSIRVFFNNKSEQSEKVSAYTDQTKRRLSGAYKTYMKETNLLIEENGALLYRKPILDLQLETVMKAPSLYPYFKALTGVA